MSNKLLRKVPNRLLSGRNNYFLPGGPLNGYIDNTTSLLWYGNNPVQTPAITLYRGNGILSYNTNLWNMATAPNPSNAQLLGLPLLSNVGGNQGSNKAGLYGSIGLLASTAASLIGSMINNINSNDIKQEANNMISSVQNALLGKLTSADNFDNLVAEWGNNAQLSHIDKSQLGASSGLGIAGNALSSGIQGSAAGAGLGPIGMIAGGVAGTATSLIGGLIRNHQAKKQALRVNDLIDYTNDFNLRSLQDRASNLQSQQMDNLEANYAAYGGNLFRGGGIASRHLGSTMNFDWYKFLTGLLAPINTDKPNHFGGGKTGGGGARNHPTTITKYKEKNDTTLIPYVIPVDFNQAFKAARERGDKTFNFGGKDYSTELGDNPNNWEAGRRRIIPIPMVDTIIDTQRIPYTETVWAYGGELDTQGGNFTNGLTFINNGGSHETNPYEGVPVGVDSLGIPNLVEQGETIFNDYVFSNRLKVPKAMRNKYKLGGTKSLTFADASKKVAKESEERPNDPISLNGLEAILSDFAISQELLKAQELQGLLLYAYGGELKNLYGDGTNHLRHNNSGVDFDYLYKNGSRYMNNRNYVLKNWDSDFVKKWRQYFIDNINSYNKDTDGFTPYTLDSMTKDEYERLSLDKRYGAVHSGTMDVSPSKDIITLHKLRKDDSLLNMPLEAQWYRDRNSETGKTWDEAFGNQYSRVDNGKPSMSVDPNTGATVMTYYYDPVKKKEEKSYNNYFRDSKESEYGNALNIEDVAKNYDLSDYGKPVIDEKTGDRYYTKLPASKEMPDFSSPYDYAPLWMNLGATVASAFNTPDLSTYNNLRAATDRVGNYTPVRSEPVDSYLVFRPTDRDAYLNPLIALANATQRNILNTSGLNRGMANAAMLASDYNTIGGIGDSLLKQALQNRLQELAVKEFNRATKFSNRDSALKAAIANLEAQSKANQLYLSGLNAAETARLNAKSVYDATLSSNLSALSKSMSNLGRDRVARLQMAWIFNNGYVPGYTSSAYGGKIKRVKKGKKGLTY